MPKPNFFIVGFPKCGTTSLQRYLDVHPNVFMSDWKEPGWFTAGRRRKPKSFEEYLALFDGADPSVHAAVGEATTGYIFTPGSLEAVRAFSPDAKIIVMLREPVSLVRSLHMYLVSVSEEDVLDFNEAWKLQDERAKGKHIPAKCVHDLQLIYGHVAKQGQHVKHLYEVFPAEQILVLFLDDFKKDPRGQYLKALEFLGLPDDGRTDFPVENKSDLAGGAARVRGMLKNEGSFLYNLAGKLRIRKLIAHALKALLKPFAKKQPVDPVMQAELKRYFAEDVKLLEQVTGRDLGHWRA
ncbi:MAG TPA: sulfotransferase [Fimbriimonas sp.]|nr:sulfotransferase [Fimbriimonas sp.]